jgi:hypothetical protein
VLEDITTGTRLPTQTPYSSCDRLMLSGSGTELVTIDQYTSSTERKLSSRNPLTFIEKSCGTISWFAMFDEFQTTRMKEQ